MKHQQHVMIDIETLGTRQGSAILAIGACRFELLPNGNGHVCRDEYDLACGKPIDIEYYQNVCLGAGNDKVDDSTFRWWLAQPDEARKRLGQSTRFLGETIDRLRYWLGSYNQQSIWFKGPDFDSALLKHAYEFRGIQVPWPYNAVRDVRTYLDAFDLSASELASSGAVEQGTQHDALEDALFQARCVVYAYKRQHA